MTRSCLFCYTALEVVPERPRPAQERCMTQPSAHRLLGWRVAVGRSALWGAIRARLSLP